MNTYRAKLIALAVAVLSANHELASAIAGDAIDLITNEPTDVAPPAAFVAPATEVTWLDEVQPTSTINNEPAWNCPNCLEPRTRSEFTFRRAVRTKCTGCYAASRRASMAARKRPQISLPGLSTAVAQ